MTRELQPVFGSRQSSNILLPTISTSILSEGKPPGAGPRCSSYESGYLGRSSILRTQWPYGGIVMSGLRLTQEETAKRP